MLHISSGATPKDGGWISEWALLLGHACGSNAANQAAHGSKGVFPRSRWWRGAAASGGGSELAGGAEAGAYSENASLVAGGGGAGGAEPLDGSVDNPHGGLTDGGTAGVPGGAGAGVTAGNLHVTDSGSHTIRGIRHGLVETLAGTSCSAGYEEGAGTARNGPRAG